MSVDLKTYLRDVLTDEELDLLVRSYDVIGHMAVIIIAPELLHHKRLIGEAIIANTPGIQTVAMRDGQYGGEFRTIPLKIIAGIDKKEVGHRESGVRLLLNPEEVYFSVRSGAERRRIALQVRPGEEILVLFSGVGPYPLVIASCSEAGHVVGIEKNPRAHSYAMENLARNKKITNVEFYPGDVADVVPAIGKRFDRIIMPLPQGGEQFLPLALSVLRPGGMLHYYELQQKDHFAATSDMVAGICRQHGRPILIREVVKCGHCGPRTYRICVDCTIG